jgi:hypothetical protein
VEDKNPTIIVGHYGSGKTEFTANYSIIRSQKSVKATVLADMDIVNPYFRVRELKTVFEELGIEIISSNYENDFNLDTPALSTRLQSCFQIKDWTNIIDVGGDPAGANILARYSRFLTEGTYNMWIAVNANRPKTSDPEKAVEYFHLIEKTSKLKITGIINTTHMLKDTTVEDILKGDSLSRKLSEITGVPVVYTVIEERLFSELNGLKTEGEVFPIRLFMRPHWMDYNSF